MRNIQIFVYSKYIASIIVCKYFLQRLHVTARSVVFVNHVDHVLTFKSNNVLQTRFSRGFVASIYEIIGPVGWETVSKSKCKNVPIKSDLLLLWERGLTCHVEPYFFLDLIFFFFFFLFFIQNRA